MIHEYAEIFCWKNVSSFCNAKATHIFSAKNIRILYIESAKTVNEMTLNELVKLTTLWTTGTWSSSHWSSTVLRKRGEIAPKKQFLLFTTIFSIYSLLQESNYKKVVVRFIFSSILQVKYVEVRISRSNSESPFDFEITRVDCRPKSDATERDVWSGSTLCNSSTHHRVIKLTCSNIWTGMELRCLYFMIAVIVNIAASLYGQLVDYP